ncbi:hypothetical protein PHISP_01893 [Aspergillus sp. HF37]|nr:hypothetical protein PHISP_01893 [Aspergillus sp. HF37]
MPRGADYDNKAPQSDNAIEQGENKAHGVGDPSNATLNRTNKTAELPEEALKGGLHSGQGSSGPTQGGSGKGGHEPKTMGENKGLGAHKADGPDPVGGAQKML